MSEIPAAAARRRRADAERNRTAVRQAAIRLLGEQPEASTEEIAAAAGVARQTVYAHYPTRDALLAAAFAEVATEVTAALSALDLQTGSAAAALDRWVKLSWDLIRRYPLLLHPQLAATGDSHDAHLPITGPLLALVERGQRSGEFDRGLSAEWLVAATIGLGHAAGQETAAGRMTFATAEAAFGESVRRLVRGSGAAG